MCVNPEFAKYDDVDNTIITIKFANGALGVIDNTRSSCYGYDQRTEVQCSKGCVQVTNDLENTAMISCEAGVEVAKPTFFFLERYNGAFIEEVTQFCKAIKGEQEVPVGGYDGLQPVLMAKAAKLSLKEGRPVKISEVEASNTEQTPVSVMRQRPALLFPSWQEKRVGEETTRDGTVENWTDCAVGHCFDSDTGGDESG